MGRADDAALRILASDMKRESNSPSTGISPSRVPRLKVVSGFGGESISTSRSIREGSASASAFATSPPID